MGFPFFCIGLILDPMSNFLSMLTNFISSEMCETGNETKRKKGYTLEIFFVYRYKVHVFTTPGIGQHLFPMGNISDRSIY